VVAVVKMVKIVVVVGMGRGSGGRCPHLLFVLSNYRRGSNLRLLWLAEDQGRKEERKKGRKEERKKGRKEERKKGRKEGR
jgi:hypothetical protein